MSAQRTVTVSAATQAEKASCCILCASQHATYMAEYLLLSTSSTIPPTRKPCWKPFLQVQIYKFKLTALQHCRTCGHAGLCEVNTCSPALVMCRIGMQVHHATVCVKVSSDLSEVRQTDRQTLNSACLGGLQSCCQCMAAA